MVGRNERCPCGSGKKYKKCCGAGGKAKAPGTSLPRGGGSPALAATLDEESLAPPARPARARPTVPEEEQISPDRAYAILSDLRKALDEIGEKHGVCAQLRKSSFSQLNLFAELEVSTWRSDGLLMTKEATDFLQRCEKYGLEQRDLGRAFRWQTGIYLIVGLNTRRKEPVICREIDKTGHIMCLACTEYLPPEIVREQLAHFEFDLYAARTRI